MQLPHFQRLTARSSAAPTQIYKGKSLNLQYSVMTGAEKWHHLCLFELGWHNNDTAVIVSVFTILLILKDIYPNDYEHIILLPLGKNLYYVDQIP